MIGTAGVVMTLFLNFYMIFFGRIIFGFASGVLTVATPRYIEEYVPLKHYGPICAFF